MSDQNRNALPKGHEFEGYRIERELGAGGFGITYLAVETDTGRRVAIKEYLPKGLAQRAADSSVHPIGRSEAEEFAWGLARFQEEARTLVRLRHPNIVLTFRFFRAHGTAYLVMDYVEGESLGAVIGRAGRLSEAEIREIVEPLIDGLKTVHAAGFLHRDIKPDNIFIRADSGAPVLLDFGAAREALGRSSRSLTAIYSQGYAPYEQYGEGAADQGPWTDIYALAATAYRCLAGEKPPPAPDRVRAVFAGKPDPIVPAVQRGAGDYAPAFLAAIDAGLRIKESERPQSMAAFDALLRPDAPVTEARREPLRDPPRRRLPLAWVAGLLLAGVAAAAGGYALIDGAERRDAEDVRRKAEAEADRKLAEDAARARQAAERKRRAEDDARRQAELARLEKARREAEETRRKLEEERKKAEEAARKRAEEAARPAPARGFRDCAECPEMVVIPAGSFVMGSPEDERNRDGDEGPQHAVRLARPFALGKFEVTVGEYAAFLRDSGHRPEPGCAIWNDTKKIAEHSAAAGWRNPGFAQTDRHPAVCVSWLDATAYVEWLARKTGRSYRLPSEAEREYAARAGTTTRYFWGDGAEAGCRYANAVDESGRKIGTPNWGSMPCDDGHVQTAPVGSYAANRFGLHDTAGNVWEWTQDCWSPNYEGAPADGSAWRAGDCSRRVIRGGSWRSDPRFLRSADRAREMAWVRGDTIGLRVAMTLPPGSGEPEARKTNDESGKPKAPPGRP